MRAKRRMGLVRFIAKALLNPFYRPEWAASSPPVGLLTLNRRQVQLVDGSWLITGKDVVCCCSSEA
jgi:hypothetical protein